ncbi:MAG: bifunctional phosphoglucose/phosphomannose isomerase, partial [Gemmatimonadetes bacterium]|nr:bifunctional phosphoglucose/phosphomannose isomerase [Gemmatimonadota bacterium]
EKARQDGVAVIGVPSGFVPRAAVAYMTVSAYVVAHLAGVLPDPPEAEIEAAATLLEELVVELGPEAPNGSAAKALAGRLPGRVPVIYGAGMTAPVARRWKGQLNENSGIHAFWNELPEVDHNEIMGWETAPASGPFAAVFLADAHQHERTRRRLTLTARLIQDEGSEVHILESRGAAPLERVMSLVLTGDLVSIYLCAASYTDPSSMEVIERLKAELG